MSDIYLTFFSRWREFFPCDEVIQRHIEEAGHLDEGINTGCPVALLIHPNGTCTNMEFLGQLDPIQAISSAELCDSTG